MAAATSENAVVALQSSTSMQHIVPTAGVQPTDQQICGPSDLRCAVTVLSTMWQAPCSLRSPYGGNANTALSVYKFLTWANILSTCAPLGCWPILRSRPCTG